MKGWKQIFHDWSAKLLGLFSQREKVNFRTTEEQPEKRLEKIRAEEIQEDFMLTPPNKYAVTETGQIIRLPERNKKRYRSAYKKEPRI
ncbi:MAG: hypothetical protein J7604_12085 [Sporocytophaga sp.]|uniref:hypothetical protein n=1 Tax=Sporocytophaga sp. TaxID=2231183 RepID=UPI001B2EA075|nr:hypothetical protein [Sporocytophaga sp.]MBO9700942.1 hypothetical protein [Sporocytophaga sp.]